MGIEETRETMDRIIAIKRTYGMLYVESSTAVRRFVRNPEGVNAFWTFVSLSRFNTICHEVDATSPLKH